LVEKNNKQINNKNRIYNNGDDNINDITSNIDSTYNNTLLTNVEETNNSSNNNLIDIKDKLNKNLKINGLLEKEIEVFNIVKASSDCLKFLTKEKMIFTENIFNKAKTIYIYGINNNIIKNDYIKILFPEDYAIITEINFEEASFDIYKNINLM